MTPTDPIPFTIGMAETIAAGLDHAGAHTSATALRRLMDEAYPAKAGDDTEGGYRAGYAAAEGKAGDTIAALQSRVNELEEAVRVLGAECNNKRDVCLGCSTAPNYIQVTEEETDANPIASAALEAARKEHANDWITDARPDPRPYRRDGGD